jgi:ABC-type phosphate transport system substrate-binding protein
MFRSAVFSLACCVALSSASAASALCNGPSFLDTPTPAQQTDLQAKGASTLYDAGNTWFATKGETVLTIVGTLHLPDPRHDQTMDKVGGGCGIGPSDNGRSGRNPKSYGPKPQPDDPAR